MDESISDFELVQKAQQGDAQAFGELYERHVEKVFRFFYERDSNKEIAEDQTEEVFLRAWRSLPKFDAETDLVGHLLHIAHDME